MRRLYMAILFLFVAMMITACNSPKSENVEKEKITIEEKESFRSNNGAEVVSSEKVKNTGEQDNYVFHIQYNGEYYFYNESVTICEPEIEVGPITSKVESGTLPKKDMEANEDCIGDIVYTNPNEEVIYLKRSTGMQEEPDGLTCYMRFEKGTRTWLYEECGETYVGIEYEGGFYQEESRQETVPEGYKKVGNIHSWGNSYGGINYTASKINYLGGEVYASEENKSVIYVKSVSITDHERGVWKCKKRG